MATGLVIVAGHVMVVEASTARDYDGTFALWLLVALLPVAVYAAAPRGRTTTLVCGGLLLAVTAGAWTIVRLSTNGFVLLAPGLDFFVSLAISIAAALSRRGERGARPCQETWEAAPPAAGAAG